DVCGVDRRVLRHPPAADQAVRVVHGPPVLRRARPAVARPCAGGAGRLPADRRRCPPRAGLEELRRRAAALQRDGAVVRLRAPAGPGWTAVQPGRAARRRRPVVVQHGRLVHLQHQLAGVLPRDDDELPHPDEWPRRPELPLGRDGDRRRRRADPRLRAAVGQGDRQLLGRHDPCRPLHPAADLGPRRARLRGGRCPADGRRLPRDRHGRGRCAARAARPGRLPGGDQDARHERWRHPERQLLAPLREPQRLHQPRPDAADLPDPGGPDLHLRQDGRQREAGLGHLRRDEHHVLRRDRRDDRRGAVRQPEPDDGGSLPGDRDRRGGRAGRQHGEQGAAIRHQGHRAVRGDHHRRLLRRRQRDARLVHRDRRHDPAGQHRARRGDLRRGGSRAVRHPDLRGRDDLHRGSDGWADARV
ncbi:MAG: Potassium-transporting ATPase A chain, partial [uncultured Thermomicrobiales bacterium]